MVSHAVKPTHPAPPSPAEDALPSLADVLDRVAADGPQIITRGEERFVVLSAQELKVEKEEPDFIQFLLNGPRFDGVEIEHEPWDMRDVDL